MQFDIALLTGIQRMLGSRVEQKLVKRAEYRAQSFHSWLKRLLRFAPYCDCLQAWVNQRRR